MAELEPVLIKDLGALTAAADTDYMILGSGAEAKKITVGNLKASLGITALSAQIEDVSNQFTGVAGVSNIRALRIGKKIILNFHTSVTGNVVTTQTLKPNDTYGMYVTAINGADLLKLKYGFGLATGVFLVSVRESYSLVAVTELDGRASCVCIYDIA